MPARVHLVALCVTPLLTISAMAQEAWNPGANMGPVVNSPLTEKASDISADGQTLYFHHNTPMGDINIFHSEWDGSAWGPPIDLGVPVNSPQNDYGPSVTTDGNKLYFTSDRPGGQGSYDIYVAERVGNVWQPPVNLGPIVNSSGGDLGQDINADDTVLWMSRGWPEGSPTDEDIYYTVKVEGEWTTPVPWEMNTVYLEDNPNISSDGNKLYFTAIYDTLHGGGYGSFDIWVSEYVGGVWQTPVNLGPGVNTEYHDANPSISWDDNTMYFTRDEPGGYGGFDLYTATRDSTGDACTAAATVPALVTVRTGGPGQYEQFVVRVVGQALLDQMIDICLGNSPEQIVLGDLLTGNDGYNQDSANGFVWSWHLDEETIALAEFTIELCDGSPSFVEAGLQYWIETVGSFCPWSSQIVAVAADTSLAGDFDIDGDVDVDDAALLQGCFTGSGSPCYNTGAGCCAADMDGDADIDCADWDLFVPAWTEPGNPPGLPQCANPVPAVSVWGMVAMTLVVLTVGTIVLDHRRRSCGPGCNKPASPAFAREERESLRLRFAREGRLLVQGPQRRKVERMKQRRPSWPLACALVLVGLNTGVVARPAVADQLPIHVVYVNHVEVESVIDYVPPLVDGATYVTTPTHYANTRDQLEWEIAEADSVGAYISFHMSGAYAERAVDAGGQAAWAQHLADGHAVGVHFHSFLRGASPFEWIHDTSATQPEVVQAWQDNHDLVGGLVGAGALWVGESHYSCNSCWIDLGYRLRATEQMALLPADQHIVWLVERDAAGEIVYPHFPQIGQAGWHGPTGSRIYFDLRLPQLKKEFLMLYLEWLERERLNLDPQVWAWGWNNHGGGSTVLYAAQIQEMLTWLSDDFVGWVSPRGNIIAAFVSDHLLSDIFEDYEAWGQPLPSPLTNVNDQFPYVADALKDAGVTADLSADLDVAGIRLFELERDPPEDPLLAPLPRVYLLFRETDGSDLVDISEILAWRGVDPTNLTLIDVTDGSTSQVDGTGLMLGPTPMVLEAAHVAVEGASPFGFHPAGVFEPGYPDNGYIDAQNIGVRWTRQGVYAFWFLIQPDLSQQVYNFTLYDQQWSTVPQGINILGNIAPQGHLDEGRCLPGSWIPVDVPQYIAFVEATIERYDGDGIGEEGFDGGVFPNPVKYWQVGNEPNDQATSDFAVLHQITYVAIKQACPDCTVLVGGVAGFPDNYIAQFEFNYAPILAALGGRYVDVFDFHWYGTADGEYRLADTVTGQDVYDYVRNTLVAYGFPTGLPIWITEMGSYSGDPFGAFPYQTEREQAGDYFKRFVYSLSRGVEKVFPAFGLVEGFKHDDGYFDHTGLIYDGLDSGDLGLGIKKLAYYTYKKMTEKLERADWLTITLVRDGTDADHLYLVRVIRDGLPLHIAWWDYFDEPGYAPGYTKDITLAGLVGETANVTTVVPNAELGQDVTDYASAFDVVDYPIVGGSLAIPLGEDPVIIETTGSAPIPTVSEWGMIAMTLLVLTAGTLIWAWRSSGFADAGTSRR